MKDTVRAKALVRHIGTAVALLITTCTFHDALAQSGPLSEETGKLRQRTDEILSDPEFRHLIRSKRGTNISPSVGSESDDDGDSTDGKGEGGKAKKDRNRSRGQEEGSRRKRSRNDKSENEKSSDSSSGPSFPSLGGSFGALLGPLVHGMAWLIIAAIVGMIGWLVYSAIKNYQRPNKLDTTAAGGNVLDHEPDKAPGDTAADVYVSRARDLASRGQYREAVAHLLLGAMSHIERAGLIRFRRGLTHRDYLRAVRRKDAPYRSMDAMVGVYEPLGFGRREATQDHFERTLLEYQAGFRETSLVDA